MDAVKAVHPDAVCAYNYQVEKFKVYKDNQTWVAISAGFSTQPEAWADAVKHVVGKNT